MLPTNFTKKDYIISYNIFWDECGDRGAPFLTKEEYYIYATLYTKRMMDYSILANIHLIHDWMLDPFHNSVNRNKNTIKESIISLVEKKVLYLHNKDEIDLHDMKFDTSLELMIHSSLLSEKDKNGKLIGYEEIFYMDYKRIQDVRLFYMYSLTHKFLGIGGFKCSYGRWADILGCSPSSAKRFVNQAIKDKVLYVNKGNYIEGTKKQDVNTYSVIPFSDKEKSWRTKAEEFELELREREEERLEEEKLKEDLPF